jgi:hypothetical protein
VTYTRLWAIVLFTGYCIYDAGVKAGRNQAYAMMYHSLGEPDKQDNE